MIFVSANTPLQAECTAVGADWFRSRLGQVIETPEHGPAVIQRVDTQIDQCKQEARYYVTVIRVPSWVDAHMQGCSP